MAARRFSEYLRLLMRLQELAAAGRGVGREAEHLRGQLAVPESYLTPTEVREAQRRVAQSSATQAAQGTFSDD